MRFFHAVFSYGFHICVPLIYRTPLYTWWHLRSNVRGRWSNLYIWSGAPPADCRWQCQTPPLRLYTLHGHHILTSPQRIHLTNNVSTQPFLFIWPLYIILSLSDPILYLMAVIKFYCFKGKKEYSIGSRIVRTLLQMSPTEVFACSDQPISFTMYSMVSTESNKSKSSGTGPHSLVKRPSKEWAKHCFNNKIENIPSSRQPWEKDLDRNDHQLLMLSYRALVRMITKIMPTKGKRQAR